MEPNHDAHDPETNPTEGCEVQTSSQTPEDDSTCCSKGFSCLKQVVCRAWTFVFSKPPQNENNTWDEVQITESYGDDSDQNPVDQSSDSINPDGQKTTTLRLNNPERVVFKGTLSEIYKQQEKIMQTIQTSNQKKDTLDVFNMERQPQKNTNQVTDDSGLPKRLIDSIVTTDYVCSRMSKGESGRECPICTVSFEEGDAVKILQCLHTYHKDCVDIWLSKKSTCPDCKFNLRTLDLKQFI